MNPLKNSTNEKILFQPIFLVATNAFVHALELQK
jgi:hypothetical protein